MAYNSNLSNKLFFCIKCTVCICVCLCVCVCMCVVFLTKGRITCIDDFSRISSVLEIPLSYLTVCWLSGLYKNFCQKVLLENKWKKR